MAGRPWTDVEDAAMRDRYPCTPCAVLAQELDRTERAIYMRADTLGLSKTAEYLAGPASGRLRSGAKIGGATRFQKGHSTWNAGKRGWQSGGRSAETQFGKGQMPHNHKPVGYERINADGVTERKIAEPKTFRAVHVLVWEESNGSIPAGHLVIFKDRNRRNIVIENLELVTRAENMRRNSRHTRYSPEVNQLIQLKGALNRKINARSKQA